MRISKKIEEYSFDSFGVRTDIIKLSDKNKTSQEKLKIEDDNPEDDVKPKKNKINKKKQ